MDRRSAKRLDRYSQLAMIAAKEAMQDSGISADNTDMTRMACIVGSGIGGLGTIEEQTKVLINKGHDRISPMYIPMSISNMASGNIAIEYGIKGESFALVTACATGTHCIGESYRLIKHGYQILKHYLKVKTKIEQVFLLIKKEVDLLWVKVLVF